MEEDPAALATRTAHASSLISRGYVSAIFNDPEHVDQRFPEPVVQCLQVRGLGAAETTPERYRLVISDMEHYIQGMMATQANHLVHNGGLERGCILKIKKYTANRVKGKNIIIILEIEVVDTGGPLEKLGKPESLEKTEASTSAIAAQGFYTKTEPEDVKPQIRSQMPTRAVSGPSHGPGNVIVHPIEGLSPYQHKWTIKARVTAKSPIKTWHKPSGEGKLFSVNLLDETGEIKATGFNDQCDKFYDLLQEGQVYYISSPCRVQMAKKQFSNLPNDYELTFEDGTQIEKAEDQSSVPQMRFNFCNIQELEGVEKDATIDVIGVLKDPGEMSQITSKASGKHFDKRELTLVDDSGYSVRLTLWGKTAENFDVRPESIVAFRGVKVSDFGGRSLSLLNSGTMAVDPDIPEAHRLKGWYDSSGRGDNFATHNQMGNLGGATGRQDQTKTVAQVKDENLGMEDVAYFNLLATIVYIRQENIAYPACMSEGCSKKVTEVGDGTWRCEKCQINHPRPEYRYILSVNVNDHTGQLWLSCFDEVARVIMGKSADDIMALKDEDEKACKLEFENANCRRLNFRCRAKMDTFGDTQRVRYQVMSASQVDFRSESAKLVEMIKQFNI